MYTELPCPECGGTLVMKDSKYGKFYGCTNFPKCDGKHSAHQHSGKPMGPPANKETRQWRIKAHAEFDKLWRSRLTRKDSYKVLAELMGVTAGKAHIGM